MRGSIAHGVGPGIADVTFFFDPLCPWTWRAARWLTTVADLRELDVEWRSFSLELLHDDAGDNEGENAGDDEGEEVAAPLEASTVALRLVEALTAGGRGRDAGRFYLALGRRVHDDHAGLDLDVIKAAADDAGVGDAIDALDDARWDDAILTSYAQALVAAGPDIGSPVVTLPGCARGLHGPILGAVPEPDDAVQIWDAMTVLLRSPTFFEVKRGRPSSS